MKNIKIIYITTLLAFATSCVDAGESLGEKSARISEKLLGETQLLAMVGDTTYKLFDKTTEQVTYNSTKTLYMVSTLDSSTHYTLTLSGALLLDNKISVEYEANNIKGLESGSTTMEVLKIDSKDQRYWLWSSELLIGFILDFDL